MTTELAGRRLLVAGDPRAAALVADGASGCGAVVALAADTRGDAEASIPGHALPYDSGSEADVERVVDLVLEEVHALDGLIVAVQAETMPPLDEQELSSWERCVTKPLRGVFWLVRRSVDEWLASGGAGPIVLIVAPAHGEGGTRSAWIIEDALVSLARSVAREYGRRAITCNVVAGGSTPAAERAAVEAALFLASPAAAFVTGECLRVAEDSMRGES
jgi:3-oxoacyl-[acyl-carrier protein] reductase